MLRSTTIAHSSNADLPDCNIFVARCLSSISLELFEGRRNKDRRISVLKAWAPGTVSRGYLDPVIWSLKVRILTYNTSYDEMSFGDLTDMARAFHHIRLNDPQPARISTLVPVFGELVKRTLIHVFSGADQERGKGYLDDVVKFLKDQSKQKTFVQRTSSDKPIWDHIGMHLVNTVLQVFTGKASLSEDGILDEKQLGKRKASFKKILLSDLDTLFDIEESDHLPFQEDHDLFLACITNALKDLEVSEDDLAPIKGNAVSCLKRIDKLGTDFGKRLEGFLLVHPPHDMDLSLNGDVTTKVGRIAIRELAMKRLAEIQRDIQAAAQNGKNDELIVAELLATQSGISDAADEDHLLTKLLELNYIIQEYEGPLLRLFSHHRIRSLATDLSANIEDRNPDGSHIPNNADVYDSLCKRIWTSRDIREFLQASEIMSTILRRTKV